MNLEDIFTKKITVSKDPKIEIRVRAINLADILAISQEHLPAIQSVLELSQIGAPDSEILKACFTAFPDFCTKVLSLASKLPEEQVQMMPFTLQVEILEATASLTFSDPDSIKKVQGIIGNVASKMIPEQK